MKVNFILLNEIIRFTLSFFRIYFCLFVNNVTQHDAREVEERNNILRI